MTYDLRSRARRAVLALTIVLTLGVVVGAASALAQAAPPQAGAARASSRYATTIRDARTATQALLDQTGAASMSVALSADGRVVWQQGFGYADIEAAPVWSRSACVAVRASRMVVA